MRTGFIEHVNITVSQPERSAKLLQDLFGWHVRWQGPARDGGRVIHVGDDANYLAVYAEPGKAEERGWPKGAPLNHVGIQVDDLDAVEQRVIAAVTSGSDTVTFTCSSRTLIFLQPFRLIASNCPASYDLNLT